MITTENIFLFLDLCSAVIIFLFGYYVFLKDSKKTVNRVFFLLTLAATTWAISSAGLRITLPFKGWFSFGEALKKIGEEKIVNAILWNNIGWIGVVFLPSTFFHLGLIIANKKKFLEKKIPALAYLISILFLFYAVTEEPNIYLIFYIAFTVFLVLCLLIPFIFLIKSYLSLKSFQEKAKLKYFLAGFLIPGIGGVILDIFIPLLKYGEYQGTRFSLYSFALGYLFIAQGVLRHGLFIDYREILETVFKRLTELVIVTDKEGLILLTNESTLSKLNFKEEEITSERIATLFQGGETTWQKLKERLQKQGQSLEDKVIFQTKDKEEIPFLLALSQTREGIILVGRDIKGLISYQEKLKEEVEKRTKELEEIKNSLEEQVKERTKELQKRVEELERFHKLTVGRELKMIELKREIERLKKERGEGGQFV